MSSVITHVDGPIIDVMRIPFSCGPTYFPCEWSEFSYGAGIFSCGLTTSFTWSETFFMWCE
ncbi:MAG: hypothetical protein H7X99_01840 [Saprospiraceae bacterium]|nr:hypothetical protein [Saprospiraceae bacterium]